MDRAVIYMVFHQTSKYEMIIAIHFNLEENRTRFHVFSKNKNNSRSLILHGEGKNRFDFLHGKNCKIQVFLIGKNERFLRSQSQMQKLIRTNLSTFTDVCLK